MNDFPVVKKDIEKVKKEQLTLENRKKVLDKLDAGESQKAVAKFFNVGQGVIRRIKENRDTIQGSTVADCRKRANVTPKFEKIEQVVVEFLRLARERGVSVTSPMLRTLAEKKAKDYGVMDFAASDGW